MDSNEALPEGHVKVEETGASHFQERITLGRHEMIADEPIRSGGADSGPSPYEFLLAALGSCTAMTVRLYAERHDLPLNHVSVFLGHERVHHADAADGATGALERITRDIQLEGPELTADDRARLIEVANRCPVHRTLTGKLEIRTQEVPES